MCWRFFASAKLSPRIIRDVRDQFYGIVFKLSDLQGAMNVYRDDIGTTDNWNRVLKLLIGSQIGKVITVDQEHG